MCASESDSLCDKEAAQLCLEGVLGKGVTSTDCSFQPLSAPFDHRDKYLLCFSTVITSLILSYLYFILNWGKMCLHTSPNPDKCRKANIPSVGSSLLMAGFSSFPLH